MRTVVLAVLTTASMSSYAVELDVLSGQRSDKDTLWSSDPRSIGLYVSTGEESGVRYGALIRGTEFGESSGTESQLGLGISYRFRLGGNFYVEPFSEYGYSKYYTSQSVEAGSAYGFSPGIKAAYRIKNYSLGISVVRQFRDADISTIYPDASCTVNCTGIEDIIYDPYAGLNPTPYPNPEAENDLRQTSILEAYVGVAF